MSGATRVAVVDVGSNSLRLLLCEGIGAAGARGERDTTVVGLKRGAGADGAIAADAIERLDARLADYAGAMRVSSFIRRSLPMPARAAGAARPTSARMSPRARLSRDLAVPTGMPRQVATSLSGSPRK